MTYSYSNLPERRPDVMALFQEHSQERFDRFVREGNGISICINVPYARGQGVKSTYGGKSAGKIARLADLWKQDPGAFTDLHPASTVDAIREFLEDNEKDAREAERVLRLCQKEQLPPLPEGYRWEGESGGIIFSDHILFYRVWHPKFGYMPQAE